MIAEDKTLITLYHNTSNSNAINIAKSGIKAEMRLQAYGKGSEAEGSGIWCTTVRGYGYGGATITFQISQDDKDLWKANDTEYVVYRDININEIIDIDLLVAYDIVINGERNDNMDTVVESDIPAGIKKFGKDKLLQVFKNYPDLLVSPYSFKELEHLINTGEKYCMGKIKVEEDRTKSNKSYVLRGLENSKSFDIAYNDSRGSLENFMAKLQPAHPNVHMWIEENDFVHNPTSLREAKQVLVEVSRNELLALTKSDTITRYNKASGYKGFSITDIDTSNILRDNTLVITCKVGDYHDTVELEDILYWIQVVAENTNSYTKNQVNTKVVTQAIMNSIDGMDIKVDCECGDWKYRFAYQATVLGYKYGKPETRPNRYKRTNMDNVGALCFKAGTKVVTDKGLIDIENIKVGDLVFTHKGRLKPVTDVGSRYVNSVTHLHIGTQDIYCTEEHPFLTCSGRGKNFKFEEAGNLGISKDRKAVSPNLKLNTEINNISPEFAFMLGLYLADGTLALRNDVNKETLCSGIKISVSEDLKEVYDKKLCELNLDYTYHKGSTGKSAYYYIKSPELRDFVFKYGGMNYHTEYSKYIDKEVLNWSEEAKLSLIKGFFAGDGQYCSNGKYLNMRFLNTNKNIIDMLSIIMKSFGIHTKISMQNRKPRFICENKNISNAKPMYCITVTGKDIDIIDDEWFKLIKGSKSNSYKRSNYKSRVYSAFDTEYVGYSISNIENIVADNIVYNISVADDDSYLVSNDMIAVHNCKHLTSMLSNKRWLQQVTSKVMDFIEQNIDAVNAFLKPKKGMELTLPNELARQNAKTSWQNRRNQKSDEEDTENNDNITDIDNNADNDDISVDNTSDNNNSVDNDNKDTVDNSIDNSVNKSIDGENGEEE